MVTETELTLIRRWCYAPKRHVMDCTEGLHSTLVKAAGGPFEHGDWESPYPLPYHCDDPCVILEPRLRPAARAAMLDCVLNLLVQPLITVRLGVLECGIASVLFERAARRHHRRDNFRSRRSRAATAARPTA